MNSMDFPLIPIQIFVQFHQLLLFKYFRCCTLEFSLVGVVCIIQLIDVSNQSGYFTNSSYFYNDFMWIFRHWYVPHWESWTCIQLSDINELMTTVSRKWGWKLAHVYHHFIYLSVCFFFIKRFSPTDWNVLLFDCQLRVAMSTIEMNKYLQ